MTAVALVVGPILIGLALYALPRSSSAARWAGAAVAGLCFVFAFADPGSEASARWLSRPFTAAFHFGFGPVSWWLVLLLAATTFAALVAFRMPRERDFTAQMLVLLGAMNGVFLARDLMLFALFWDLMLIPVFLIMVGWGVPSRTGPKGHAPHGTAAWRYLVYNLVGGLALLLGTAAFGIVQGTTDVIGSPTAPAAGAVWGFWIFCGFAFAFLVKTPVWPFHTWMPDTYAELPPPAVAVVSAVQSKAGLYGFIAIGLPFFGAQMRETFWLMAGLGTIGLVYGAFVALAQRDMKRIVAYSSLSHLALILLAIFTFDPLAIGGASVYLIAHGLFSAALFLALGYVEIREETRDLGRLGGLMANNPRIAAALHISALAALGLPGLAGFAGELLIITGIFHAGYAWLAVVALIPIVIAAAYMLRLFQETMNGPKIADLPERRDLTWAEGLALVPLVAGFILLGVNPGRLASDASAFARDVNHAHLDTVSVGVQR